LNQADIAPISFPDFHITKYIDGGVGFWENKSCSLWREAKQNPNSGCAKRFYDLLRQSQICQKSCEGLRRKNCLSGEDFDAAQSGCPSIS
jgi:hypothetical protein